jgi:hypothetical protein
MYYTMGIMIVWLTIVAESNRLFLKIIAKSITSQLESTERNPSCSPINACAGPPQNLSRRGARACGHSHDTMPQPHLIPATIASLQYLMLGKIVAHRRD